MASFSGAQTCSDYNSTTFLADITLTGNGGHSSGQHGVATGVGNLFPGVSPANNNIQGTCNYSAGSNGYCATAASVNLAGSTSTVEQGTLNPAGSHNVSLGWASGSGGNAGGSATATGSFGGGACYTAVGNCSVSVSVSVGSINLSISGGQQVWAQQSNVPFTCPAVNPTGGGDPGGCTPNTGAAYQYDPNDPPPPCDISPILIDTEGEGFHLTSAEGGVIFDISGTGHPIQMGWTDPRFHNAFLALPGADGLVHNGKQLFGNFTPQSPSPHPNGFLALAEFDKPENGGNGDGVIDENDAVYSRLRLWIDENHDGISQSNELHSLSELGIYSLALSYFESRRTDQFGDQFRYKGRVNPGQQRDPRDQTPSGDPGRWTYDVFFTVR